VAPEIGGGVRVIDDSDCVISLAEIEYSLDEIVYGAKTIIQNSFEESVQTAVTILSAANRRLHERCQVISHLAFAVRCAELLGFASRPASSETFAA